MYLEIVGCEVWCRKTSLERRLLQPRVGAVFAAVRHWRDVHNAGLAGTAMFILDTVQHVGVPPNGVTGLYLRNRSVASQ